MKETHWDWQEEREGVREVEGRGEIHMTRHHQIEVVVVVQGEQVQQVQDQVVVAVVAQVEERLHREDGILMVPEEAVEKEGILVQEEVLEEHMVLQITDPQELLEMEEPEGIVVVDSLPEVQQEQEVLDQRGLLQQ